MITSIEISKTASYNDEVESLKDLKRFNYLFGSNGSGKTTVSRVIANEDLFPTCTVKWLNNQPIKAMVYNRDFVERNFGPSTELKGVFTLGEENLETLKAIKEKKEEVERIGAALLNQKTALADNATKTDNLETELLETCWAQKDKHEETLKEAFKGSLRKELFKQKVIDNRSSTATLLTLTELEEKAVVVFGDAPLPEDDIQDLDYTKLLSRESEPLLSKPIIGKENVAVSELIQKLGNGDWVGQGRPFLEQSDETCPFCQQPLPEGFEDKLNDYFDATFVEESQAFAQFTESYKTDAQAVQSVVAQLLTSPNIFVQEQIRLLKTEKATLDATVAANLALLNSKKSELSRSISLDTLKEVLDGIQTLVDSVHTKTKDHNATIANLQAEQATLKKQVWRFVVEELKTSLEQYDTKKKHLVGSATSIRTAIKEADEKRKALLLEVQGLEKETTSVQPTLDAINGLLDALGFKGFSLAKVDETKYKLVREDGSDAKDTLSEGERSFVTFLYFYYRLQGSVSGSDITEDRIVVIDDPVSSLDSDILFIVSSLIRKVCADATAEDSHIKQVIVLTHNVYFHKEVTYGELLKGGTAYWIVRKPKGRSRLVPYGEKNPIKTSYQLLWEEVFGANRSAISVQNAMRRILEHYFKTLGGTPVNDLPSKFTGNDRLICHSLISWVHDGSHQAHDDWFVCVDDDCIEMYLRVFKSIFDQTEHSKHYEMMCRAVGVTGEVEEDATEVCVTAAPILQ